MASALLEDSKARVVAGRTVTAVSRTESGAFVLDGDDEANEFDAVVLAMPVEEAEKLSLKGTEYRLCPVFEAILLVGLDGKATGLFSDCNCEVNKLYHHFVQGTVSPSITKV